MVEDEEEARKVRRLRYCAYSRDIFSAQIGSLVETMYVATSSSLACA